MQVTSKRAASSIAGSRPRPYVVVGVDTSESARNALRWAGRYAGAFDGTVVATTALPDLAPSTVDLPEAVDALERKAQAAQREARERLERLASDIMGDTSRVVYAALPGGVVDVLLDVAADADLLVVGNTPRGALGRALLRSVRPSQLTQAACPVVLVRGEPHPGRHPR
ncbi:MAG TPA: universal stress protein [Acidimicrobiales bacterium]|nr:universal stress protein [Acidimicrobiales bacterium]